MQITVLGKSPAWQDAGGAGSGYLVDEGETTFLVDCGCGVFGKLREAVEDFRGIDAVYISHLHADHCFDLIPFAYALVQAPHESGRRPRLYLPEGSTETLSLISGTWGDPELIGRAFDVHEFRAEDTVEIGPSRLRFAEVPHYIPAYAVEVTGTDGGRFVFGADCGPNEALVELASDCDLLLIEATLEEPEDSDFRGHLTAREAGEHARDAGAARTVLTHISDELDHEAARQAAAGVYDGEISVAFEGAVYQVFAADPISKAV